MDLTDKVQPTTPILFVHGAWHGAWCWYPWMDYFKHHGVVNVEAADFGASVAVSNSLRNSQLEEYVKHLEEIIETMEVAPILVGHSMGAVIVQHLAAKHRFPAVVLLTPLPGPGTYRKVFWSQAFAHPMLTIESLAKGNMSPWTKSKITPRLFFSDDMPRDLAKEYIARMHGEPATLFTFDFMHTSPPMLENTPLMVMGAQKDRFFNPKIQRVIAESLKADYFELPGSGHDIMLDVNRDQAASLVIEWLEAKGVLRVPQE